MEWQVAQQKERSSLDDGTCCSTAEYNTSSGAGSHVDDVSHNVVRRPSMGYRHCLLGYSGHAQRLSLQEERLAAQACRDRLARAAADGDHFQEEMYDSQEKAGPSGGDELCRMGIDIRIVHAHPWQTPHVGSTTTKCQAIGTNTLNRCTRF